MYRVNGILTGPATVTGNTAKVKVLLELAARLDKGKQLHVLDVGCTGPQPLEFWEPVLNTFGNIELVGIDVEGIEAAKEVVRNNNWHQVQLLEGSGYHLTRLFPKDSFDIIVATQVLEHMARPLQFLQEVAVVLRPDGELFLTLDSAHWEPRFALRHPRRFVKNIVKKALSLAGNERHYDLPWYDFEVTNFVLKAGFKEVQCRYYNLHPLKFFHNRVVSQEKKNKFMKFWFDLEEVLNESINQPSKRYFMGLYLHAYGVKSDCKVGE